MSSIPVKENLSENQCWRFFCDLYIYI